MGSVIGQLLPLALGIAISPIPIIAAILMLLSPRAKATSVGFLLGWVIGIVVAVVVFTLLAAVIPATDPSVAHPISGIIQLVLGALLLLLAVKQWRSRPKKGQQPTLPKWMNAIDSMTAARGLVLGFILSAVNPKNLMMAIAAGLAVGGAGIPWWQQLIAIVIFVVIAACSVAIPVIAYLIAAEKMRPPLGRLHTWLADNNATIMAVLLLVIGVVVIGKGIGQF